MTDRIGFTPSKSLIHGPGGSPSSDDSLFCGPERWRTADGRNDTECEKICRFSGTFYDRVKQLGEDKDPEERLGSKLKERLMDDPMFPVFHQGLYYKNKRDRKPKQKVHFVIDNFLRGFEEKSLKFLAHVDQCVKRYGADQVFI